MKKLYKWAWSHDYEGPTPIYSKSHSKIFFFQNQRADGYETWYVAFGMPAHYNYSNCDPTMILRYFTPRSILVT